LRQDAINFGFKLVALVYAYFDEQLLALFDEIIYINDEEEKFFSKLEKVVESAVQLQDDDVAISQRELDVIRLVALGKSNREIAEELFISVHTVISHRKNITNKLGIKSVSGLTIYAVINKLIGAEDFKT
jgi:DNA-binding CsgD family transcriptional regulator